MPPPSAGEFLTVQEAARLLKISPVTIKRWLKQGRLRAYHVGPRAVRIRQDDLAALLTPTAGAAEREEVSMSVSTSQTPEERQAMPRPQPAELARRRRLVATIHARRAQRVIAPVTAENLVHQAREEAEGEQESGHAAR